jgi:hypothetical protein
MIRSGTVVALVASVLAAADTITVREVFSSGSISEYNRWLRDHGSDYPALRPTRISVKARETSGAGAREYVATFFDLGGNRAETREFRAQTGGMLVVTVSRERDRLLVYKSARPADTVAETTAVYNANGDAVAQMKGGYSWWEGGLLYRPYLRGEGEPYRPYTDVLGPDGRVRGRVDSPFLSYPAVYSPDTTYVLQLGVGRVVVIDRYASVLWDTVFAGPVSMAISNDSRWVAVGRESTLTVRNMTTGQSVTSQLAQPPRWGYSVPAMVFSIDGRRIAAYRQCSMVSPAVGILEFLSVDGRTLSAPIRVTLGKVRRPPEMGFIGPRLALIADGKVGLVGPDGVWTLVSVPSGPETAVYIESNAIAFVNEAAIQVLLVEEEQ